MIVSTEVSPVFGGAYTVNIFKGSRIRMAIKNKLLTNLEWRRLTPLFQDMSDKQVGALYESMVAGRNISEAGRLHGISRQQTNAAYKNLLAVLHEQGDDTLLPLPIWLPTARRDEIIDLLLEHQAVLGRETPPPGKGGAPAGRLKLRQPRYTAAEWEALRDQFDRWEPQTYKIAERMLVDGLLPVEVAAETDGITMELARRIRRRADQRIHDRSNRGRHQALVWVKREDHETMANLLRERGCLIGGDE